MAVRALRIYLAGKITGAAWREDLVIGLRDWEAQSAECHRIGQDWPVLHGAIGGHDYVGPYPMYSLADDLCGTFTVPKSHASGADTVYANGSHVWGRAYSPCGDAREPHEWTAEVVRRCKAAIDRADLVFVWFDATDAYGTLVEVGYAIGSGKRVLLGLSEQVFQGRHHDLWFAEFFLTMTQSWPVNGRDVPAVYAATAQEALWALVAKNTTRPDYYTYIASPAWREKATAAKARAGHKCQVCNANDRTLDAHHRTYERLGHELATDITVLCRPCHELFETQRKTKGMAS